MPLFKFLNKYFNMLKVQIWGKKWRTYGLSPCARHNRAKHESLLLQIPKHLLEEVKSPINT